MSAPKVIPLRPYVPPKSAIEASREFYEIMNQRRTVREFSNREVPAAVIENIILAAGTAPSGANKQPWRFVAVRDPAIKREIRVAAEAEEREFYSRRATETWLRDLAAIGTDEHKPFLEVAPWLIVVFKLMKDDAMQNESDQVYYVNESVGIAVGLLLAAAHHAGLATLTHTPSPMKFLAQILRRPDYERPYLLIPVGYPADDCTVPNLSRKPLRDIMTIDR
ncbi:MAG TPA: nitroreductase family protein [Phycisphaerales bacterium]|nr:nitroreductase family protein [Phycisphaerales bacterium]HRQ75383.1 nitroreductase family protein [Phycisphaerales bacterium]